MSDLRYFDANAMVGKVGYKHPRQIWRAADLLAEADRAGIGSLLVWHGLAKMHAPMYGNRELLAELPAHPRLVGAWVALPDQLGDFPAAEDFVDDARRHGIAAAKLFPATHGFELDRRTAGALLDCLARAAMPLLIDAAEVSWPALADVLSDHPRLPVVLQGLSWSLERKLFPLLDEFDNLHVEFSALQSNRIIEVAYQRYGADRLLFGSGAPFKSFGAARAFVDYARIPDEAKAAMAGGTLARLLNRPPASVSLPEQDEVTAQACRGLPLAIPVFDSHTHPLEDGGATGSGRPMIGGDIDSMVDLYRHVGIDKMSIAPWVGVNGGDADAGNHVAEVARDRHPHMVEAYARLDPNYGIDMRAEALKWHVQKKFRGVKPYYYNERIPYTDPRYAPWWEVADELCLYALVDPAIQSDDVYIEQIDELARRYPNVSIFMDHAGRSLEIATKYAPIAAKHPNVTVQLTYTTVTMGAIEYLVEVLGPDKILFGTDSAMRDPRPQVGWLAYANISLEDKKKIFGANFQAILDRTLVR